MELAGKRAIVTGGARGIGAAIVHAYALAGVAVTSLDVLDAAGGAVAEAAKESGPGGVVYRHCDISHRDETKSVFHDAVEAMGGLDVLVNVAGVEKYVPAEDLDDEEWTRVHEINARGTFITNQLAFGYMKARGGRIINFGSNAGMVGVPGLAHYSASKGAVLAWTRTIAQEWGRYGITVNAIAPGMWTPMYDHVRERMSQEELAGHDAYMAGAIPLGGKLGDPQRDLAPVLVFLASDGARFITGQTIAIDGGLTLVR